MIDIDAIEARLKATTPGEWRWHGGTHVAMEYLANENKDAVYFTFMDANGQWVAHAHNYDIPELIAEIRRWHKVALALKQYLEKTPNFDVLDERYLEPTLNLFSALAKTDGWSKADDVESIEDETREGRNDG